MRKGKYTCKGCGRRHTKKDAWDIRKTGSICHDCGMAGKSYLLIPDIPVYTNSRIDQARKRING